MNYLYHNIVRGIEFVIIIIEKENKPNLLTLMNLSTSEGDIKIIQKSAKYYRGVGIILLNDRHGDRVDVFQQDTRWQSEAIVLKIYTEWLAEDPNCSWMTLTDCFRQCGADRLAYSIEQHFGLPSPQQNPEGISILAYCFPFERIIV